MTAPQGRPRAGSVFADGIDRLAAWLRAALHRSAFAASDPLVAGYVLAASLWCAAIALGAVEGASDGPSWYFHRLPQPYDVADYSLGYGFFFTPPIAILIYPLTLLSWPMFAAVWTGASLASLGFLLRRWAFVGLLFPPIWWEISSANVALLMGAAIVVGMRRPVAWAFVILLKVTPAVALAWYPIRREWRPLAIALGTTAAIVAITLVAVPGLWADWSHLVTANAGATGPGYFTIDVPLAYRLLIALAVVGWGARTGHRWTIAVAATLGTPVLWYNALALLAAVPRLVDDSFGMPRPFRFGSSRFRATVEAKKPGSGSALG